MSFPKNPIHIVFLRSMTDDKLKLVVDVHCDGLHQTVHDMCMSLAKLLRDNDGGIYITNKYGVKRYRATNSYPQITVECIDDSPTPVKYVKKPVFPLDVNYHEIPNPFKENQNMKVVYYKNGKMHTEITHFTDYEKFKNYPTRIYPADYEPADGTYGFEKLIDCW